MLIRLCRGTILAMLLVIPVFGVSVAEAGPLRANGRFFRDASGRAVILRGVNVAGNSKVPPFTGILSASQLDPLPGWGVNVIRLVFSWEAYQPLPGQFNAQYLNYLGAVADAAWQRGIYTIVDFHEDAFSRYLAGGCGDGFPFWAIAPGSTLDPPNNGSACSNWAQDMFLDPDVAMSFSEFYSNSNGVRTQFLNAWKQLAQTFSAHPGIIGYDLLNEPWGSETTQIAPLYRDAAAVIHSVDPSAILFIEPVISTATQGTPTTLPAPSFPNVAYAPHFYDPSVVSGAWDGSTTLTQTAFANMNATAAAWNVPLFVGEFGAPAPASGAGSYLDLQYQGLNGYLASGAQWNYTPGWTPQNLDGWNAENYSIVDDQGNLRANFKVRPYAQKISGTPLQLTVSSDGTYTRLVWIHSQRTGFTQLFVPLALFGSTPVMIDAQGPNLFCGYSSNQLYVICASNVDGLKSVTVRPCNMASGVCQ